MLAECSCLPRSWSPVPLRELSRCRSLSLEPACTRPHSCWVSKWVLHGWQQRRNVHPHPGAAYHLLQATQRPPRDVNDSSSPHVVVVVGVHFDQGQRQGATGSQILLKALLHPPRHHPGGAPMHPAVATACPPCLQGIAATVACHALGGAATLPGHLACSAAVDLVWQAAEAVERAD
jgi:hypothetical protein